MKVSVYKKKPFRKFIGYAYPCEPDGYDFDYDKGEHVCLLIFTRYGNVILNGIQLKDLSDYDYVLRKLDKEQNIKEFVDNFYSMPPKHRTKENLEKLIGSDL